jgi:hypothetical protein
MSDPAIDYAFGPMVKPQPELPWLEFELPAPPSVNRFMGKLGNSSPVVKKWAAQADLAFMVPPRGLKIRQCRIIGEYEAEFVYGYHKGDLSNPTKPLEDWLQSREFIENDRFCRRLELKWSEAVPDGRVLVRLRPWMSA